MEATAAARGGQMPIPPQPSRKEWRAVSDHHSVRNVGDEELDRTKLGQSEERTMYEQGREPLDVGYCSITIDGSLDNNLQQQYQEAARQRAEMQHLEIELRAQMIARSDIIEMQNSYDAQIKEHANAAAKLQEQLHERDQTIHELERKLEDKERELHAIKLDNEAAWAKEDLLREQNKELATFRRERDHSEAERAQHIKKIHDLQEHFQDKERRLMELQEQHRVAQEAILYKDEQLREAQTWITRVQEMDGLQSTTLQAELRERTEQYNQLWLGCQRQFAEMERLHMHSIQQLQLELADAREKSGAFADEARISQENSKDISQYAQNDGNQLEMNGGGTTGGSTMALPNGNSENVPSFASSGNASTQIDHAAGVPIAPSSLLGMPSYLQPGQLTALHPFVMHQQGVPQSVPPHVPHSHVGHFHSIPGMSSFQQWQTQQAVPESVQASSQTEQTTSQADQNLVRSDQNYNYEMSVNGTALSPDYRNARIGQETESNPVISSSTGESQALESINRGYLSHSQSEQELKQISSHFHDALGLESFQQNSETEEKEQSVMTSIDGGLDDRVLSSEQPSSVNTSPADTITDPVNLEKSTAHNATDMVLPEAIVSTGQTKTLPGGRTSEPNLLDEKSLLTCIVRTIPAGGRIRIGSTLPNRLGKMLAPLHWHDYKKKYGRLDDFVAGHPELFVIEGDYILLREGAQEMIAATAAVAKVAAAAATPSPYSPNMPSVAVTPMAQNRPKKNQQPNGVYFGHSEGISNVKILSKSADSRELNGPESRPNQTSGLLPVGNGANLAQSSGSTNGRSSSNFGSKQQGRFSSASFASRR
ncbi:hypothetical protein UlMin_024260 [Ulmus minor]